MIFTLEIQGPNPFFDLASHASQVAPLHVAGHVAGVGGQKEERMLENPMRMVAGGELRDGIVNRLVLLVFQLQGHDRQAVEARVQPATASAARPSTSLSSLAYGAHASTPVSTFEGPRRRSSSIFTRSYAVLLGTLTMSSQST